MYSSSSSSGPLLREPKPDELASLDSLRAIFTWARLTGDPDFRGSAPGALLRLLGGDGTTEIDEFAAVSTDDLEIAMVSWLHTDRDVGDGRPDHEWELDISPTPIVRSRVRVAHHAAMICTGVIRSRFEM